MSKHLFLSFYLMPSHRSQTRKSTEISLDPVILILAPSEQDPRMQIASFREKVHFLRILSLPLRSLDSATLPLAIAMWGITTLTIPPGLILSACRMAVFLLNVRSSLGSIR